MAHSTSQGIRLLNGFKRLTRFDKGLGARLPEAYKKFWIEWKIMRPVAVHYIPKEGEWERDIITGEIKPIQNIPLPLIDPPESNEGIWGGESIVRGFQKRNRTKRRVPHYWVPSLRRSVVHSQVLNKYMSLVVTDRTLDKIHESHGFDHYLLKYPACDLRSTLALKLKREVLTELLHGCPTHNRNPSEQNRVMKEYQCYLESYTPEEIDWYGHTYREAIQKLCAQLRKENAIRPHKVEFRLKLIEQLRKAGIPEAGGQVNQVSAASQASVASQTTTAAQVSQASANAADSNNKSTTENSEKTEEPNENIEELTKITQPEDTSKSANGWLSRINPFGKKRTT